jgi:hypothetical protein
MQRRLSRLESRPKKLLGWGAGGRVFPQLETKLGNLPQQIFLDLVTPLALLILMVAGSAQGAVATFMQEMFSHDNTNHVDGHVPKWTQLQGMDPQEFGALANRPSSLLPEARFATVNLDRNAATSCSLFSPRTPGRLMHTAAAGDSSRNGNTAIFCATLRVSRALFTACKTSSRVCGDILVSRIATSGNICDTPGDPPNISFGSFPGCSTVPFKQQTAAVKA